MIEEKKTEYLFWDEMWNEPIKEVKKKYNLYKPKIINLGDGPIIQKPQKKDRKWYKVKYKWFREDKRLYEEHLIILGFLNLYRYSIWKEGSLRKFYRLTKYKNPKYLKKAINTSHLVPKHDWLKEMREKKTEYLFWDEMWNETKENNENKKTTSENSVENPPMEP